METSRKHAAMANLSSDRLTTWFITVGRAVTRVAGRRAKVELG